MNIRPATYKDAPFIKLLLQALGYQTSTILLIGQLEKSFGGEDNLAFVCELNKDVAGFISVHFIPQLGFERDLAIISYLAVDENHHRKGIGKALEAYVTQLATQRKCDQIQLHCPEWRTATQKFYKQQGYQEYSKYYSKPINHTLRSLSIS